MTFTSIAEAEACAKFFEGHSYRELEQALEYLEVHGKDAELSLTAGDLARMVRLLATLEVPAAPDAERAMGDLEKGMGRQILNFDECGRVQIRMDMERFHPADFVGLRNLNPANFRENLHDTCLREIKLRELRFGDWAWKRYTDRNFVTRQKTLAYHLVCNKHFYFLLFKVTGSLRAADAVLAEL